jgi:glycosyltransferase involved in cell wall biosynthesis
MTSTPSKTWPPGQAARRIAVYSSEFLPTSQTFVYNQIKAMRALQADVICRRRLNADRFPEDSSAIAALSPRLASALQRVGRVGRPGKLLAATAWHAHVYFAIARRRPALILAHFGPGAMQCRRAAALNRIPLVPIFHGFDATEMLESRAFAEVYPGLLDSSAVVIAVSNFVRNRLIAAGVTPNRIQTLYIGIPIPALRPPHAYSGVFLQVGRLVEKKGHEMTLRAFARARATAPELKLRVVGDGPLREHLQTLAKALAIEHCVQFLGDLPPSAVQAELERADVFLHPSVTAKNGDAEGLGLSIVEAMAQELPVISTLHGGIPEVVTSSTGILVEEHDIERMTVAISELAGSEERRRALGIAGRIRAISHFDIERNTAELEFLLLSLIGNGAVAHEAGNHA